MSTLQVVLDPQNPFKIRAAVRWVKKIDPTPVCVSEIVIGSPVLCVDISILIMMSSAFFAKRKWFYLFFYQELTEDFTLPDAIQITTKEQISFSLF